MSGTVRAESSLKLLVSSALLLAQSTLLLFGAVGYAATSAPISHRLHSALADLSAEAFDDSGRLAIWVYFSPRELSAAALSRELDAVERTLSDRAVARRSRLASSGRIADVHDLPVDPASIDAVVATGADLRRTSRLLNAASFDANPEQIEAIASLSHVVKVDLVARYTRTQAKRDEAEIEFVDSDKESEAARKSGYSLDYGVSLAGLEQINVPLVHDKGLSGQGVTVALFDTGFELTHECLQHIDVVATHDFVGNDEDVGQELGDPEGSSAHGTEMLGILAGFSQGNLIGSAYGASVILARTEDIGSETQVEEDNWIAALEWADALGADVVSSSVGYYSWYEFSDLDGDTAPITVAADLASLRGVCVVVSAGNERMNPDWPHIIAPADGHNVIAVGGVQLSGFLSYLSSPGPTADGRVKPDIVAQAFENVVPFIERDDVYVKTQGVDAAVPLVAGAVALMREQNPGLTPLQIREALRETASRSLLPDNDYGWGVTNVLAASGYWAPRLEHQPLGDQEFGTPFTLTANVGGRLPIAAGGVAIYWRSNGGAWQRSPMTELNDGIYEGTIPRQTPDRDLEYYVAATNELGLTTFSPISAPEMAYSFHIGADTVRPQIAHTSLPDVAAAKWPPRVSATASDNLGIDRVEMFYSINGGNMQGPLELSPVVEGYEAYFPFPPGVVPVGTEVEYVLHATDTATLPNSTVIGPFEFEVVEQRGRILLVTSRWEYTNQKAAGPDARGAIQVQTNDIANATDLAQWLIDVGFSVDILKSEDVVPSSFLGYDVAFYTAGNTLAPLSFHIANQAMVDWVRRGGRLIIEGGDLAYVATTTPDLAAFQHEVLHIDGFGNDDGSRLSIPAGGAGHPFVHRPHDLPSSMAAVSPAGVGVDFGLSDVVFPKPDAQVVLQSAYGRATGGVVLFDDNTGIDAGQIVYIPLDIGQMPEEEGRALLENAATYLTVRERPGPSAISGRVSVPGAPDNSSVVVRCDRDHATVTGPGGEFVLDGLWGGEYLVTASLDGFAPERRMVPLSEGQSISDVAFFLRPVVVANQTVFPDQPIPDNDPTGIQSSITVTTPGPVADLNVDVDIQHFSTGNLEISLTSPSGTTVTLLNPSESIADDLVGNWPRTLLVEGPGSLADFLGEVAQGDWTLSVSDHVFGGQGRLNSWGLNLMIIDREATAAESPRPSVTRLTGVVPNPFNPHTSIHFELARAGTIGLAVYDVQGRMVRVLAHGETPAGAHVVAWDGTDSRGAITASGVYFARLVADGLSQVQKMVLVR